MMRIPELYRDRCRVITKPARFRIAIGCKDGYELRTVTNKWLWKYTADPESLGAYRHGKRFRS